MTYTCPIVNFPSSAMLHQEAFDGVLVCGALTEVASFQMDSKRERCSAVTRLPSGSATASGSKVVRLTYTHGSTSIKNQSAKRFLCFHACREL